MHTILYFKHCSTGSSRSERESPRFSLLCKQAEAAFLEPRDRRVRNTGKGGGRNRSGETDVTGSASPGGGGPAPRSGRYASRTRAHTQPVIPTGGRCPRAGPQAGGAVDEQQQRDEMAEPRQARGAAGGGEAAAAAAARLPQGDAAGRPHGS